LLLSEPVAKPDRDKPVHQVQYYWDLLKPLGLSGEPVHPELFLSSEEERSMADRLQHAGIAAEDLLIGLNPGSTYGRAKRWLPDRFAETAERLCRRFKDRGRRAAVVLLGAKGEEPLGREIASRLTGPTAVLSGSTTIRELMAVIQRCAVLVTNDTGPMHVASAFHVPVVAIFGPTDWRTTSPYGEKHALIRQAVDCAPCMLRECPIDHRCMTGVTVEKVVAAAANLMATSEGQGDSGPGRSYAEGAGSIRPGILEGYTIFLDRDGTLNEDPGYLKSAADLKLLAGVGQALARLKSAGARLVVVTNQSGVGRGFLTLKDLEAIHARLEGLLEQEEAALDAIYFCPHHPDDGCLCRKPARGMIDRAVSELHVDLRRSYVIGDHASDIQLAKSIAAKAILVTTGRVDEQALTMLRAAQAMPDAVARSLAEAAEWILNDVAATQAPKAAPAVTGER
jgi:heptosyltransferase-2